MSNDLIQPDSNNGSGFDLDVSGESPRTSIFDSLDTTPAFTFPVEEVPKQVVPSPVAEPTVETPEAAEPVSTAPETAAVDPQTQSAGIRRTIQTPEPREAKRRPLFKWVFILLLLGAVPWGGWFLYTTVFQGENPDTEILTKKASTPSEESAVPDDIPTPPIEPESELPPLPETPAVPDDIPTPPAAPGSGLPIVAPEEPAVPDDIEADPDIETVPSDGTTKTLEDLLVHLNNSTLPYPRARKKGARLCIKRNNFSLAEKFIGPLFETESEDGEACFLMGSIKFGQGKSNTAIEHFSQSIEHEYKITESHYQRGLAHLTQNDAESTQKAIDDFTVVVAREPSLVDAWFQRALLYQAGEQHEDAISDFSEVLKLEPANLEAVVHRANLFHITDKPEEAKEDYGTAIKLDPENYSHWRERALLRRETGDNDGAMSDMRISIKLREKLFPTGSESTGPD